jgi:hypothetical protein
MRLLLRCQLNSLCSFISLANKSDISSVVYGGLIVDDISSLAKCNVFVL